MIQLPAAGAIFALLALLALLALILLWRRFRAPATDALPPAKPVGLSEADSDGMDRVESMAGFGSWDYDIGARRLSWSPQLFRLLGMEDTGGVPDLDSQLAMVLEADRTRLSDAIAVLLHEGSDQHVRLRVTNRHGEIRHLRLTGLARRDAEGRPLRLLGTVGDFTASEDIQRALADSLKQAEHQSSLLRTINRSTLLVARKLGDPDLIQMLIEELRSAIGARMATLFLLRSYDDPRLVSSISVSDQYAQWRGFGARMFADLQLVADIPAGRGLMRLSEAELLAHPVLCALAAGTTTRPILKGLLSVPVFNHTGSLVGLLALSDPADGEFSADDEFLALAFSQIASAHIDIARLVGKVQRSSHALSDTSAEAERNHVLLGMAEQLDGIGLFKWAPASPGNDAIELSPALQRILGVESPNTDAATLASLCIDEDRPALAWAVSDARAGRGRELQLRLRRPLGELRWLQVRWDIHGSGDQLCIYGVVKDASRTHQDARLLQQTREDLAQRENEARELDTIMLEHLSPGLQQLGTAVAKLQETLPRDGDGQLPQAFARLAGTCASIDDIFAGMHKYMHVLAPGGTRLTIRPSELLSDALADFDPVLLEIGARVTRGDLPELHADPVLMRIVFSELIDNAIKFRHPERRLEIGVSGRLQPAAGQPGQRRLVLSFTDNGLGFESRLAVKAFSPLVRLQRRSDFPGHGMGLALVQRICQRHSGQATVESQPGTGTTVRIELPYQESPKESQSPADRVPDKESMNES